ncbi:hypothetical protein ABID58_001331 [Bradyrhizobium sp. S3.2.6]
MTDEAMKTFTLADMARLFAKLYVFCSNGL